MSTVSTVTFAFFTWNRSAFILPALSTGMRQRILRGRPRSRQNNAPYGTILGMRPSRPR